MDDEHHDSDQPGESYFSAQSDNSGDVPGRSSEDPDQRLHSEAPQPSSEYSHVPLDPAIALGLSGRVISVTFTVPFVLRGPGDHCERWEVSPRSRIEHSVQYDILSHLTSAKGAQAHITIGWTGEISGSDPTHSDHHGDPNPWLSNDPDASAKPTHNAFVRCFNEQLLEEVLNWEPMTTASIWMAGQIATGEGGWPDYLVLMDAFAAKVCEYYRPGDIVMVHDYALMALPQILRNRLPNIHLTFSLHAGCPSSIPPGTNVEVLSQVLQGALGSDLITFQSSIHHDQFLGWCAQEAFEWAPYVDSLVAEVAKACFVHPMAIDTSRVISTAESEDVSQIYDSLKSSFADKKIIVSYNTVGYHEETAHVARAFDRLETQFPEWKGKVVFLQITSLPCWYKEEEASGPHETLVDALAARNNNSEPRKWSFKGRLSEEEHYALLRASDTTIFPFAPEGLMKAGLDFLLCHQGSNKRPVISDASPLRFQQQRVILFPRGDVDGIARALNKALEDASERSEGFEDPEGSEVAEVAEVSEVAEGHEGYEVVEVAEGYEGSECSENSEGSESFETPESPGSPGSSENPERPESPDQTPTIPPEQLEPLTLPTAEEWVDSDPTERGETRPDGGDGDERDDWTANMDDWSDEVAGSDLNDGGEGWSAASGHGDGEDLGSTSRTTPEPDDGN
ncbi:CAZyme family GT20 [Trichoderma aggressivum f. europaeum]|uniref:CAZyme family GT20 n=1 Tax=Trichoderma aggressivum f. europaeum TaxID=173218 RepID=A0AAE1LUX6_9HYPO|nr:CAZyme family GT20 [Trichoderma aggressivum f. europaeum]